MATFDVTIQRGLKALELAKKHAPVLDVRLPPGHAAYLEANLAQLGAAIPEQKVVRAETRTSSQTQRDALGRLADLISAIRIAVKTDDDATEADKKDYAIGARVDPRVPNGVLAVGAQIIRVAKSRPQRAQQLGVLPSDIALLEATHAAAAAAHHAEDVARARAPESTRARNAAKERVDVAVKKIAGVGTIAFALEPATRSEFEALLAGPGGKKKPPAP